MKRFVKSAPVVFLSLVLAIGVGIGIFRWAMTHDSVNQSSGPVTRAQALKHCGIPLPPSAHHIEYASFASGLQDGEFWVRFEAPVADCHAEAQTIFAKWAADSNGSIPEFRQVSHPPRAGSSRLHTGWFDTDNIANGSVAGRGNGWEPRIWIDEERGVFYYHNAD